MTVTGENVVINRDPEPVVADVDLDDFEGEEDEDVEMEEEKKEVVWTRPASLTEFIDVPDAIREVKIMNVSKTSAEIYWTPPCDNNRPVTNYMINGSYINP